MTKILLHEAINYETILLENWLEEWINTYCINLKETTYASYKQAINCHINRVLGKIKLCALNTQKIQLFYNSLVRGEEIEQELSPKTVKNIHGILHKALDIAMRLGYIEKNPADLAILPKSERKIIKPLSPMQICRLLTYVKGNKYDKLLLCAIFTGMRESELIGLTWDCIDFRKRCIIIEKQLIKEKKAGGKYKFTSLKNSKARIINPPEIIFNTLEEVYQNRKLSSKFVFCNEDGNHFTQAGVYNYFKGVVEKLGFGHARFHDLRHTFAVISIEAGDDYKTIQSNMGHYSAAFTLDVYGFCTDNMRKESSRRLQDYYNDSIEKMII